MKRPIEIIDKWLQAVNQIDIEKLLTLYDKSAVLIPTFSNRLLNTPDKIREYFEKLASREELSITLREKTLMIQEFKNEMFIINGIYNWRFKVDGELLNFEARFTYIIELSRLSPIIHHHSSQVPRML
jgi:hypothetical protein